MKPLTRWRLILKTQCGCTRDMEELAERPPPFVRIPLYSHQRFAVSEADEASGGLAAQARTFELERVDRDMGTALYVEV